jgi:hypothetical protein
MKGFRDDLRASRAKPPDVIDEATVMNVNDNRTLLIARARGTASSAHSGSITMG